MSEMTVIATRVPAELAENFALCCRIDGETPSSNIRRLLDAYVAAVAARNSNAARTRDGAPCDMPVAAATPTLRGEGVDATG
ncbi:MAG: hypothetical protein ACYDC2_11160 [Solirubrobacteraceae bacterium]